MVLIMHTGFQEKIGLQNCINVKLIALKQNLESMESFLMIVRKTRDSTNAVLISE